MRDFYKGKHILITGGAGYIGQLLIEQLIEFNPAVIRILDVHENGLFNLRQKYQETAEDKVRFLLGDIRNINRLRYALNGVDIVFHTAAYKHVVECEYNPIDAVETNINGTSNVIQAALESNVERVIFTSSDKAANPSNSMGATKLLAEKLMIAANGYRGTHGTIFACCRFGNVVRSSGSVVPLFEDQIKQGKSITLTDPNMTRFLISNSKAIELVLRSAMLAHGGEVFIFKMPSINIGDLANVMMEKYGTVPKEIIGKKAGEKMYEELMTEEEKSRTFENEEMYVISPTIADSKHVSYEGFTKVAEINNSRDADRMSKDEILRLIE
ncbi:MAG: SDR family NAD(P)-dependent oxidoreductase [Chloroflexi bacterium]|jgi:UDP-N-acetylglucosamine 4,6-dehydratase/5-epimerase|nr:SDR family NAD(P)-dependent oxidoreductase [Chloroflexota bacterium]